MNIIVIDSFRDTFYPFDLTGARFELVSGCMSFMDRLTAFFAGKGLDAGSINWISDIDKSSLLRARYPELSVNELHGIKQGETLILSSTVYPADDIVNLKPGEALMQKEEIVAVKTAIAPMAVHEIPSVMNETFRKIAVSEHGTFMADSHWGLVSLNSRAILYDAASRRGPSRVPVNVSVVGDPDSVFCHETAVAEPFVTVNTEKGPVIIDQGVRIESFSRLEGPCYIGKNCLIAGATIRGGTSIGPESRVGGEIEESVFQGYSNKHHDGFLGHSIVGRWCNLGAGTVTSDLKNNYRPVTVHTPGKTVDTGMLKVGAAVGDFVKTSIGTLITTGAVIGPGAMIVHDGSLVPAHVPPFKWYIDGAISMKTRPAGFLATARTMMERRGVSMTADEEEYFASLIGKYA